MQTIGNLVTPYGKASIHIGRYPHGGAIFIGLRSDDPEDEFSESLATFSVNLKSYGCPLDDDEFNVKNWEENACLVEPMLATGLFEVTGKVFPSGFVVSPVWRLRNPEHVPASRNGKAGVAA